MSTATFGRGAGSSFVQSFGREWRTPTGCWLELNETTAAFSYYIYCTDYVLSYFVSHSEMLPPKPAHIGRLYFEFCITRICNACSGSNEPPYSSGSTQLYLYFFIKETPPHLACKRQRACHTSILQFLGGICFVLTFRRRLTSNGVHSTTIRGLTCCLSMFSLI